MLNNIYNIPAYLPFSDTLANWIIEKYGLTPTSLSRVLIILPSRRACMALRDAFLRATSGKPLLLPRMQPIGDVNEDALIISGNVQLAALPTTSFEFKRLFIIAKLIMRHNNSRIDHAFKLAVELAGLLDEIEREQVSIKELAKLVPEDFAQHWQVTVDFLKIISEYWPQIARQEAIVSNASYLNEMHSMIAKQWQESPPGHPVIAAGIVSTSPAAAGLIQAVAALADGMIVLPGLDVQAGKEYLENIDQSHAQYGMLQLLGKLNCQVDDVQEIVCSAQVAVCPERTRLLSEIMRPAVLSQSWQTIQLDITKSLSGMKRVVCSTIQEEATVISVLLRETLEYPGKTAALVTNDRTLARRVCSIMKRFDVNIDDSAGIALIETPVASFLQLVAETATNGMSAIKLVSLLKHPLTKAGMERIECLESAREFEMSVLRKSVAGYDWYAASENTLSDNVKILIENIRRIFAPFVELLNSLQSEACSLQLVISSHLQCAEELAGGSLWDAQESETISGLLSEVQAASCTSSISGSGTVYEELFKILFAGKVYRPKYGLHPRLKILSPIEARMQSFNRIILGGLNEGSWPGSLTPDPWLNRQMRETVGLPPIERSIGLASHDFFILANSPEVYLTRSKKVNGSPATPSRWMIKLDVLLARFSAQEELDRHDWCAIAGLLDIPDEIKVISAPEPRPPLHARPTTLSVTNVETWLRNPYAIYASYILRLRPLEPITRELNGSDFGKALHVALENFVKQYPYEIPWNTYEELLKHGSNALQLLLGNEKVRALWWPRFMQIARFVATQEQEHRAMTKCVMAEVSGDCSFDGFTLQGRADRIEEYSDGSIGIIDYKTGTLPTDVNIENGLSSQIILLAIILGAGGQHSNKIRLLQHWQLQGGEEAGKIKPIDPEKISLCMESAKEGLCNLINKFNDPDFPYRYTPIPEYSSLYENYEHLARIKEWG